MTEGLTSEISKVNPLVQEHTVYKIGSERIPSVTTVLGNLGWKWPALLGWQAKMLRQGIDPDATKTEAGTTGTLVHLMIEAFLKNTKTDLSFFSDEQISKAKAAFSGFKKWYKKNDVQPLAVEEILTHRTLRYGGTIDLRCMMNEKHTLVDWKSATAIFVDHRIQAAAYAELIRHRYKTKVDVVIVHLNKETGVATPHEFPDLKSELEVFRLCLKLHRLHLTVK